MIPLVLNPRIPNLVLITPNLISLEKGMATHSGIPRTEEAGGLQSIESDTTEAT